MCGSGSVSGMRCRGGGFAIVVKRHPHTRVRDRGNFARTQFIILYTACVYERIIGIGIVYSRYSHNA